MQLTSEMLTRFVGGQMEIQNKEESYIYRGEVKTIVVENNELKVQFVWMAKGEGFSLLPNKWIKDDHLDYAADLETYYSVDVGDDRLCFQSSVVGEMVILYPSNGSKLDPAKVEGLVLQ